MRSISPLLLCLATAAPSASLAAPATMSPGVPAAGFDRLWTGWGSANREAMGRERAEEEQLRRDLATADAERRRVLRHQGRELGEQVGEIVALGDCMEGERLARAAGDFALVEAVRAHCRAMPASAAPER